MTVYDPCDNAFSDPSIPSLKQVKEAIESDYSILHQRRMDMVSAINKMGALFNLPLSAIPANAEFFRQKLKDINHHNSSISERRLGNVKSLLMGCLRHVGLSTRLLPYQASMSAEWEELYDRLPGRYAKTGLSRFVRYCSRQGIRPGNVDDGVMGSYLIALTEESLVKDPRINHQTVCRLWNNMAGSVAGWPATAVTVPRYDDRLYSIGDEFFDPALLAEIEGFLSSAGKLVPGDRPSERVTEEHLVAYVGWHRSRGNASTTVTSCIRDLREAIRVMEPAADLGLITELTATLHLRQTPTRNKHTRIIHPDTLLKGALAYLDRVPDQEHRNEGYRAGKFRDALLIAFLACRPVRLANATSMTIGRHLVEDEGRWACSFDARETKDKRALAFSLPDLLIPYLETYLDTYRPILLKCNKSQHLWISTRRTPMSEQAIYWNTSRLTEELYDRRINPHMFRDCAASALATDDPEHILAIARILGHASIDTSNRHYNQSRMTAAGNIFHEVLAGLKQQGTSS